MHKLLIFNADDFGASDGINKGIIEVPINGVVTSASLMVTGTVVDEAVAISRDYPKL
jgi:predicted glycoside hydrolase/deacetylase ChbG (UPF0249 family)